MPKDIEQIVEEIPSVACDCGEETCTKRLYDPADIKETLTEALLSQAQGYRERLKTKIQENAKRSVESGEDPVFHKGVEAGLTEATSLFPQEQKDGEV